MDVVKPWPRGLRDLISVCLRVVVKKITADTRRNLRCKTGGQASLGCLCPSVNAGHSAGRHRLTLAAFPEPDLFRASCRRTSRSSGVSRLLCSSSSSSSSVPARHGAFTTSPKNVAAMILKPRATRRRLRASLHSRPFKPRPHPASKQGHALGPGKGLRASGPPRELSRGALPSPC